MHWSFKLSSLLLKSSLLLLKIHLCYLVISILIIARQPKLPISIHFTLSRTSSVSNRLLPYQPGLLPPHLIDHVYISEKLSHSPCDILPPLSGSDHSTLLFSLSGLRSTRKNVKCKIWLYYQADFEEANSILRCLHPEFFSCDDINHSWSQWLDFFMTTMSKTTPTKLMKSSNNIPYLSHDLTRLIHKKHRLFNWPRD